MLIVMKEKASVAQLAGVISKAQSMGFEAHTLNEPGRTALGLTGHKNEQPQDAALFAAMPGVIDAAVSSDSAVLCGRQARQNRSQVDVGGVIIGGNEVVLMAGPCAVESHDQVMACATAAQAAGARLLRGGAFKPRTSPYDFQGLKGAGLAHLAAARRATGLRIVTEVLSEATLDEVADTADLLQVGARNMQNFSLLQALGRQKRPVLLKRGLTATFREWLMAAEYIASSGNQAIILCERGIRTFETRTRNTLDLAAVPVMRALSHLPMVIDPSHGTGRRDCVTPMARAAIAAGADGLIVEVHPNPDKAWSDGAQSLDFAALSELGEDVRRMATAMGRHAHS